MLKKKVLLADDDADDREMFGDILLTNEKATLIHSVEDGKALLAWLQTVEQDADLPDLIVLDQNMPKLNGLQTLEVLKANDRYHGIPVVLFSTYANEKLIRQCQELGASTVFTKPSTFDEYEQMVDVFVDLINKG